MNLGDCFTMQVPPSYSVPHLYFVISDPKLNAGTYYIVNITGDQLRAGRECVLQVGEHPWITKESFVSFGDTIEIAGPTVKMIDALIGTKVVMQAPSSKATLAKIIAAGKISKAIPKAYKAFLY
jgi:hypothetical protein